LDNVVRFGNQRLQALLDSRYSYARAKVEVWERFDGSLSVYYQGRRLHTRSVPSEPARLRKTPISVTTNLTPRQTYPTGFKASVVITGQDVADYYSIVKDQWSKVGIDLEIMQVADVGALIGTAASVSYEGLISIFFSPPFTYPEQAQYCTGTGWLNASLISDPYIDEQAEKAKEVGITDFRAAMAITKELMKYVLDQAYCIPTPAYPNYVLWWPWLKNYSGELSVGYAPGDSWVQYVWIDQDLKKEIGY